MLNIPMNIYAIKGKFNGYAYRETLLFFLAICHVCYKSLRNYKRISVCTETVYGMPEHSNEETNL